MREVTNSISDIFITADPVLIICLIAAVAGGLGWLIARLHSQRKITQLETTLHIERQTAAEQLAEVEKTFAVLSNEALRSNSQTFLQLAQETLKRFQVHAKGELEQKERAVENLVKPIRETLDKAEQQIRLMENERKQAYGALHKHLETLTQTQQTLHSETRNLVQALRRPEVRGQWGEMTLKRLVELAGMVDHCDFYEQQQATSAEGQSRPDMIVRMPDERELVVDAIRRAAPFGAEVETDVEATAAGWRTESVGPAFDAARRALAAGFGREAVEIGCGGTIPFVGPFVEVLGGVPALLLGLEDPPCNAHGENESLCVEDFRKAARAAAHLLPELRDARLGR